MVSPQEPTEYLYKLRAIAKNIIKEHCEHSEVHPPEPTHHKADVHHCEVEATNTSNSDNICKLSMPQASEVVQRSVEPQSQDDAKDTPSTHVDMHAGSAWYIPMTQERSL